MNSEKYFQIQIVQMFQNYLAKIIVKEEKKPLSKEKKNVTKTKIAFFFLVIYNRGQITIIPQ